MTHTRYIVTLRPAYERINEQGYMIDHYQLPITIMDQPQLKQIVENIFDAFGVTVVSYKTDLINNRLILEIDLDQDFFVYNYDTKTSQDIINWFIDQFNTDTKEDTWKEGNVEFNFIDNATGKEIVSYLDLTLDAIKPIPSTVTPVTSVPLIMNPLGRTLTTGSPGRPSFQPILPGTLLPFGAITPGASGRTTGPLPAPSLAPARTNTGLIIPIGTAINPINRPTVTPSPAATTTVTVYSKHSGTIRSYIYMFHPLSGQPFAIEVNYGSSPRQVGLIYGLTDPQTRGYQLTPARATQNDINSLKNFTQEYPIIASLLNSINLVQ